MIFQISFNNYHPSLFYVEFSIPPILYVVVVIQIGRVIDSPLGAADLLLLKDGSGPGVNYCGLLSALDLALVSSDLATNC